jgi:hypothetical protein
MYSLLVREFMKAKSLNVFSKYTFISGDIKVIRYMRYIKGEIFCIDGYTEMKNVNVLSINALIFGFVIIDCCVEAVCNI